MCTCYLTCIISVEFGYLPMIDDIVCIWIVGIVDGCIAPADFGSICFVGSKHPVWITDIQVIVNSSNMKMASVLIEIE